jgi:hypothetical protein
MLRILDLQIGEPPYGVPQKQNRGKTILGYTAGYMQTADFPGILRLSPGREFPATPCLAGGFRIISGDF